jgi:hypothetical protein
MTTTSVACPQCKALLQVPPAVAAGGKTRCPRCSSVVVVPFARGGTEQFVPAKARPVKSLAILVVIFAGFICLLGITAILVAVCFLGDGRQSDAGTDEVEPVQPPRTTVKQPTKKKAAPPQPLIVLSPENQQKADLVTQRGVDYLKGRQLASGPGEGSWPGGKGAGFTALAGLTLLECNVPPGDQAVQSAATNVRAQLARDTTDKASYHVAVGLLFLTRLDDKNDRDLIRSLALRLVANQLPSGGWEYACRALTNEQEQAVLKSLQELATDGKVIATPRELVGFQVGVLQRPTGDPRNFVRAGDNSCTQFALLALWNARRYELPIDPVLERVALHFRHSQNFDGSWSYRPGANASMLPTMTCAGLLGLAVGYGLDKDAQAGTKLNQDDAIKQALQVVARPIASASGPQFRQAPEMYFLWSVERVAVLYRLAKIEGKDWYLWGLELLHQHQQADGSWNTHAGPATSELTDTCFALLFLQRANLTKDLTDKLQEMMALLGAPPQKE